MAERVQEKRRRIWSGYECPACFAVFRVPKGYEHKPVYCPGCDAILRLTTQPVKSVLPLPDEEPRSAPVMEELEAVHEEVSEVPGTGMVKKKRRRRKVASSQSPNWDRKDKSKHRRNDPVMALVLVLSVVTFAAALYVIGWFADQRGQESEDTGKGGDAGSGELEILLDDQAEEEPEVFVDPSERQKEMIKSVRKFLQAPDIEALLGTIRNRDATEELVRKYYRERPYQPSEFHKISEDGVLSSLGSLVSVNVTLSDFSVKPVALEWQGDRFLVDWESWVGYSELTLGEFMDRQPIRSRLFRVTSRPVDYYNFAFSDDSKWRCFELTLPGEEKSLYGYVPQGSELARQLSPLDPEQVMSTHAVRLRFPEEPVTKNQVLIEKLVASGWVVDEE